MNDDEYLRGAGWEKDPWRTPFEPQLWQDGISKLSWFETADAVLIQRERDTPPAESPQRRAGCRALR